MLTPNYDDYDPEAFFGAFGGDLLEELLHSV